MTYAPHPEQIEAARRGYSDWIKALGWVQEGLKTGDIMREVEMMDRMPPYHQDQFDTLATSKTKRTELSMYVKRNFSDASTKVAR